MSKISCNVCMDLLPLVNDGVASKDSTELVKDHIAHCASCSEVTQEYEFWDTNIDDAIVLQKLKKKLIIIGLFIMIIGAFLGFALYNGMGMFYNVLIMPIIGIIGYLSLKKKVIFVPVLLFIFSCAWICIQELIQGGNSFVSILYLSALWSGIYAFLSVIGVLIAVLLKYAFQKDV